MAPEFCCQSGLIQQVESISLPLSVNTRASHGPAVGRFCQAGTQGSSQAEAEPEPRNCAVYIVSESTNFTWDGSVLGEEIFQEISGEDERNGATRFSAHICDAALEPRRKF